MEDFSGDIRKKVKSYPQHKPSRQTQKWTLMFVGSHGKTIIFKRFKGLAVFFMLLLFSAMAGAAGMYFLYDLQVKKSKGFEHEAEELKKQIATVRQEKESLLVRALKAESQLPKSDVLKKESKNEKPPEETPKPEAKSASDPVKEELPQLSVERLETTYHRSRKMLTLKFNVKNASDQKFSGYIIAVLKASDQKTLNVPYNIDLVYGRPVEKPQGESFDITRSKSVELEVKGEKQPERFKTASVFISDKTGRILFEKDMPVNITY